MKGLRKVNLDEILQKLDSYRLNNRWLVLISSVEQQPEILDDLQETTTIFTGGTYTAVKVESPELCLDTIDSQENHLLVLYGFEQWDEQAWRKLDYSRYRQHNNHTTILLLSWEAYQRMSQFAQHFTHWIKKVFQFDPEGIYLSEEAKESCLANLREWSGYSDQDVIRMAEDHTLPRDPEYGEWLILIDRGDLIVV